MNERSKVMFEQFGHVPAMYDAVGGFRQHESVSCYVVHADAKDESSIDFIVFEAGYKDAWAESRRQLRIGAKLYPIDPQFNENGEVENLLDIEPGKFKVRRVFALDRKPRKEAGVVTGRQLLDTAVQRGIGFNKELRKLLDELEGNQDEQADQSDAA